MQSYHPIWIGEEKVCRRKLGKDGRVPYFILQFDAEMLIQDDG